MKATERNDRKRRVPARFGRDARFTVPVAPAANFRVSEPAEFEKLKDTLLQEHLRAETKPEAFAAVRRAANDAAALAWAASFPLLLLPELFREKVEAARRYAGKQASLRTDGALNVENESEVAA